MDQIIMQQIVLTGMTWFPFSSDVTITLTPWLLQAHLLIMHHQLRLHGSDDQHSLGRWCFSRDAPLSSRNPRLHSSGPCPSYQRRHTLQCLASGYDVGRWVCNSVWKTLGARPGNHRRDPFPVKYENVWKPPHLLVVRVFHIYNHLQIV